jgi:sRNA-binding carbon storage regulator CsrA
LILSRLPGEGLCLSDDIFMVYVEQKPGRVAVFALEIAGARDLIEIAENGTTELVPSLWITNLKHIRAKGPKIVLGIAAPVKCQVNRAELVGRGKECEVAFRSHFSIRGARCKTR